MIAGGPEVSWRPAGDDRCLAYLEPDAGAASPSPLLSHRRWADSRRTLEGRAQRVSAPGTRRHGGVSGQDARRPPAGLCPGRVGAAGGDAPSQQFFHLLNRLGHPTKTRWNVHIRERYPHGAGVVTYLARSLRGGPIKNARLVAWNGEQVTFTYRTRAQEYASGGSAWSRMTLSRGGLSPAVAAACAGLPAPGGPLLWAVPSHLCCGVNALPGAVRPAARSRAGHPRLADSLCPAGRRAPERCPACGQRLVCTGVIPRGGAPPPALSGAHAA